MQAGNSQINPYTTAGTSKQKLPAASSKRAAAAAAACHTRLKAAASPQQLLSISSGPVAHLSPIYLLWVVSKKGEVWGEEGQVEGLWQQKSSIDPVPDFPTCPRIFVSLPWDCIGAALALESWIGFSPFAY